MPSSAAISSSPGSWPARCFGAMNGRFNEFGFLANAAGGPVGFAQAVENGSANFAFSVSVELNLEGGIEIIDGGQQPDDARRDQIVKADVIGQTVVNLLCDQPHLRKVLQYERFAARSGVSIDSGLISVRPGGHGSV